jgi:hypothetical protein
MKHREGTYIMRRRAERPEVTAATRKNSLALKKPVMSAITARHDPTYYQRESLVPSRNEERSRKLDKEESDEVKREDSQR